MAMPTPLVAITRAQAMLIVIGNPRILGLDPVWRAFLNYVHGCGGWRGEPIGWDPVNPVNVDGVDGEIEEMIQRFRSVVNPAADEIVL
jgi:helicase MOV-10